MRLFSLLLVLLGAVVPAAAQSPRLALVEEVTNASCVPCAAENPAFKRFVGAPEQRAAAVTIVYHANWPGRDIMNALAPAVAGSRVAYYGISGVPRAMVNGKEPRGSTPSWRNGAPGDIVALDSAVDLVRGTISPITIRIAQQLRIDSIVATVDLESTEDLIGKRLRVVLVEGEHFYPKPVAGTNGEERFLYVARAMLPDPEGTGIDLPAGASRRITVSAAVDPAWNAREMYVVAFVQDDTTHEVLQVATSRGSVRLDGEDPAAVRTVDTAAGVWRFEGSSEDSNSYRVEIEADLPPLWKVEVRHDGERLEEGDTIELSAGEKAGLDVRITPHALHPGRGDFKVTLRGYRNANASQEGRLYAGAIDMLTLRRENDDLPIADLYRPGLRLSLLSWAMVEPQDERLLTVDSAEMLVFLVGSRALDSADIALLKRYLAGGGRLFLIGSEIAWGLGAPDHSGEIYPHDVPFLQNGLHSRYVAGSSNTTAVNGVPSDPVGGGVNLRLREEWEMRTTPDRITPVPPARTALNYGANRTDAAAVRYANDSTRTLFFSFGFEGVADSTLRTTLMERGIRWLLGTDLTLSLPALSDASMSVGHPWPNPVAGETTLPLHLTRPSDVRLHVTDMIGRAVLAPYGEHLPPGNHTLEIAAGALAPGVYLIVVEVDGVRAVRRMVVR